MSSPRRPGLRAPRGVRSLARVVLSAGLLCACGSGEQHRAEREELATQLDAEFQFCPEVISLSATPLTTAVGGQISLSSGALETLEEGTYSYSWFASSGDFENAASSQTLYHCAEAGLQDLTLFVTDGRCADLQRLEVTCVEP